jgi:hypothetical protein
VTSSATCSVSAPSGLIAFAAAIDQNEILRVPRQRACAGPVRSTRSLVSGVNTWRPNGPAAFPQAVTSRYGLRVPSLRGRSRPWLQGPAEASVAAAIPFARLRSQ